MQQIRVLLSCRPRRARGSCEGQFDREACHRSFGEVLRQPPPPLSRPSPGCIAPLSRWECRRAREFAFPRSSFWSLRDTEDRTLLASSRGRRMWKAPDRSTRQSLRVSSPHRQLAGGRPPRSSVVVRQGTLLVRSPTVSLRDRRKKAPRRSSVLFPLCVRATRREPFRNPYGILPAFGVDVTRTTGPAKRVVVGTHRPMIEAPAALPTVWASQAVTP